MKPTPSLLIVPAFAALTLYIGGYFVVVHKQLQNPFISWPMRAPRPMVEYYQVPGLRVIYEPLVRVDKKLFPNRWVCPPTSAEEIAALLKTMDLNRISEMCKAPHPQGGANAGQPFALETNQTSEPAVPHRSP